MNDEWIYIQIASWMASLVFAYIGYRLGLRSQKIQALREYVAEMVKDKYPSLFSEMNRNTEFLDNYLDFPYAHFEFPELDRLYNRGLEGFMKRHHKDLFLTVDSFRTNILPKFKELYSLKMESVKKVFDIWSSYLRKSLPEEDLSRGDIIKHVAEDLLTTMNPYNVLPLLLNGTDEEIRNKIEGCIRDRTSHIYREKAESQFAYVISRRQSEIINFDEVSQSLIEKAKPEIANLIDVYKELKKQNDLEVKEKLLPLLQKYISNPV